MKITILRYGLEVKELASLLSIFAMPTTVQRVVLLEARHFHWVSIHVHSLEKLTPTFGTTLV